MATKYDYVRITDRNAQKFSEFIAEDVSLNSGKNGFCFGVTDEGRAAGGVVLKRDGKQLGIELIQIHPDIDGNEIRKEIVMTLKKFARANNFESLIFRGPESEIAKNRKDLESLGFSEFKKDYEIYNIDNLTLGTMLKEDDELSGGRSEFNRMISEGRVRCFTEADPKMLIITEDLDPIPELSYLYLDPRGKLDSYVTVSRASDGLLYLSDVYSMTDDIDTIAGLIYASLSAAFLSVFPDGRFVITTSNKNIRKASGILIALVVHRVEHQRIILARCRV